MLIDISPSGAAISCEGDLSAGDAIVLQLKELGKFEGMVVAISDGRISIQFDQSARARKRAMQKIALFRQGRLGEALHSRDVLPSYDFIMKRFTWADGHCSDCEIMAMTLAEAVLRTAARPPINDVIHMGRSAARVVLYHTEGIGVEFLTRRHARAAA